MRIYLVRHGETEENALGVIQGQTGGNLSEKGQNQARQLGKTLKSMKYDMAFVSDLQRTKDTFALLHNELLVKIEQIEFTDILRERNAGVMTGLPMATWSMTAKAKKIPLRQFRPQDGESIDDVCKRAKLFYEQLQTLYQKIDTDDWSVLVVSHGGFIKEFYNYVNIARKKVVLTKFPPINNCSVHLFEIDKSLVIKPAQHLNKFT